MGDRGNIIVKDDDGRAVVLYSHWGGSSLPMYLQKALRRGRDRWDDSPYLTAIIVRQFIKESDSLNDTTGIGIGRYIPDEEYPLIFVNMKDQTVEFVMRRDVDEEEEFWYGKTYVIASYTFQNYIDSNLKRHKVLKDSYWENECEDEDDE